jgi:hypothetical protein
MSLDRRAAILLSTALAAWGCGAAAPLPPPARAPGAPAVHAASPLGAAADAPRGRPTHDGQHDFDFDFGTWKTETSRLRHPLSGSAEWLEMNGVTVVRKVWGGKANLAELESDGPTGHLELLSLRLYDPEARQWSLHFAVSTVGTLSVPMVGDFHDGRGEFYDQESYEGRTILVRFTFESLGADAARSEQAFSDDGGKTWEINWINRYTRLPDTPPDQAVAGAPARGASAGESHDFDFNVGSWKTRISRPTAALAGATADRAMSGTVDVRKVWNGRAELEEVEAEGPDGRFEDLSLFLYDPAARQWSMTFANSKRGRMSVPAIGSFQNGRAELFDQEVVDDKAVFVRVVWSDIAADSHAFEQSFSADGGKTWEPNFVARVTR